jgi:RNA polymerase sigma-70 factor, ECF subfamily
MSPVPPSVGAGAVAAPEVEATRLLYARYRQRVLAFSLSRLGTREDAEDAVQTTFLYAFRSLRRGIVPNHELAWLLKIAQNVCRTRHRSTSRRGRHEQVADPAMLEAVSATPPRDTDELFTLRQALAGMPPRQQRAILLREWKGLSYEEIGEELGLSRSAVETLLFRARRTLAARLQKTLQTLLGPLGFLRSLLGGGSAKVASIAAVVAGTSVVALPPLQRGMERDRPGAQVETTLTGDRTGSTSGSAPAAGLPQGTPAARAAPTSGRSGARPKPLAGAETGSPSSTGPMIGAEAPSGSQASAGSDSQAAEAPSGGQPPSGVPAPAVVSTSKPAASVSANAAGTSIGGTVSAGQTGGAVPTVGVDASATTPVGSAEAQVTVDPTSFDPVTVDAAVVLPPLPPPPPLP